MNSTARLAMGLLATAATVAGFDGLAQAQMKTGTNMKDYEEVFGVELSQRGYDFEPVLIESNIPGNVLWPGDQPEFTIQLQNNTDQPIQTQGSIDVIQYGTEGVPESFWLPDLFKIDDIASIDLDVDMEANGWQNIEVSPKIPSEFGGYALVVDLGDHGRRLATTCARTFASEPNDEPFPTFSLDAVNLDVLERLGVQAVRKGVDYVYSGRDNYDQRMAKLDAEMKELEEHNITAMLMPGASKAPSPLGMGRPHLNEDGTMKGGKKDLSWLPEYDKDFENWVYKVSKKYGWPNGPVTSWSLWNEPWEGLSISGWGADMIRFRELYKHMGQGVWRAREAEDVKVLVGGADSSSNTIDKLFPDGSDEFLKYLDVATVHYHGKNAPSLYKKWNNREVSTGPVKIWDTESWMANTDDRIGVALAVMLSAGYDRTMGIYAHNIADVEGGRKRTEDGNSKVQQVHAWSTAAAYGAARHFLQDRPFQEILFKNGLPWVYLFQDAQNSPDSGTIVITGDIGAAFGHQQSLFRRRRRYRP